MGLSGPILMRGGRVSEQFTEEEDDRIVRASLAIYGAAMFRAAKDYGFEPRSGTLMHALWKQKRLTMRHQKAWRLFCDDLHGWQGKSGKVTGSYGEGGGGSGNSERIPEAHVSPEYSRLQRCCADMSKMESSLLRDMIAEELEGANSLKLEIIGLICNGYQDQSLARAAGVSRITAILDRIGDFYQLKM